MAALTLDDANQMKPPAPNWIWTLQITMPTSNNNPDPIYVQEVTIPFRYYDIKPRYRGGGHLYFPGDSNLDSVTVNFFETSSFDILAFLSAWQNTNISAQDLSTVGNSVSTSGDGVSTSNRRGDYKLPKFYLGNMVASLYDGIDNTTAALEITMNGVWPARITDWNLNYHQSANIFTACTFSCNDINIKFNAAVANRNTAILVNDALGIPLPL